MVRYMLPGMENAWRLQGRVEGGFALSSRRSRYPPPLCSRSQEVHGNIAPEDTPVVAVFVDLWETH